MRKKILLFILAALVVVFASITFGDDQEILTLTWEGYSEIILEVDSYSYDFGYVSQAIFEAGTLESSPITWTVSQGKGDECEILISSNGMLHEGAPIAETASDFLRWRTTYGPNFAPAKAGVTGNWQRITAAQLRLMIATVGDWAATPDGTLDGTVEFKLEATATPVTLLDGEYEATVYLDLALT